MNNSAVTWNKIILLYLMLLLMPALYRFLLPPQIGVIVYFLLVFFIPLVLFMVIWSKRGQPSIFIHFMVSTVCIIAFSSIFSLDVTSGLVEVFHAIKIYVMPLLLISTGYLVSRKISEKNLIRLLLLVVLFHFIFSILFYYDILDNPLLDRGYYKYSNNMIITSGDYKAFTGLTLSKFALAYQTGFILVGTILFTRIPLFKRWDLLLCITLALALLVFTYNKTMWFVVTAAVIIRISQFGNKFLRILSICCSIMLFLTCIYFVVLFLRGELYLRDYYYFLSPKTFWSRVYLWQNLFQFDMRCIVRGFGAGYFEYRGDIVDSQFLYSYLELGLLPSLLYFSLLFYSYTLYTNGKKMIYYFFGLWMATFCLGDLLGNVHIPLLAGLWGGRLGSLNAEAEKDTIDKTNVINPINVMS